MHDSYSEFVLGVDLFKRLGGSFQYRVEITASVTNLHVIRHFTAL